ncbi:MAG: tetratricopeptide repeat protein [Candidatus Omnitrophica bacterium]|nr:tetratricopeptide repeat protein [Candidatus Omnitrophota bacterium]
MFIKLEKEARSNKRKNIYLSFIVGFALIALVLNNGLLLAQETNPKEGRQKKESAGKESVQEELTIEEKLNQRIDLDYKDADLSNVLRSLSWTYDLNIITVADVEGKVTITLGNVKVGKALEAVLTVNGLTYAVKDQIIYVSEGDKGKINLVSKVITLNYIKATEAKSILYKVLSEKGNIETDESANTLIITDLAANVKKIKDLLKEIDVAPKQVLIEAKIVDITSNDLAAFGVKWNVDYAPGHGIFGRSTGFGEELDATVDMGEQSSGLTGGQFKINTLGLKGVTATATIDALVKDGRANLLASPSIAILNNQEARIVIGERYPYKERTQTSTGTTETTKFVDIGVTLKVTPQINEDGYITMRIHPEVSSLAAALDAGPRITTREADTSVRIKEGRTLIIAGLIKQKDHGSREKIPFLGDLPLIGALFSRSEHDREQKELAVFITPKIIRSEEEKAILAKKKIEREEAYVNIDRTGKLALVETLYQKAKKLEEGKGLESRRKSKEYQQRQAISIYRNIYLQHPDALRASEAMYRAGLIYYEKINDKEKAEDILGRLISKYPDSEYAKEAKSIYRKLTLRKKEIKKPTKSNLKIFK